MKIVLDADVVIHFAKADCLSVLPEILKEYDYIILDKVYAELRSVKTQLDNQICFLKNLSLVEFCPTGAAVREYAMLRRHFGVGESACMVYCRYNNDIIGSSNLRDIAKYCQDNNIAYLTTLDFLFYAWQRKVLTLTECKEFIETVRSKGSKLPEIDISTYIPTIRI